MVPAVGASSLCTRYRAKRGYKATEGRGRSGHGARGHAAGARRGYGRRKGGVLTVSQICSLICLPSMVIIRAPNSTPKWRQNKHKTRDLREAVVALNPSPLEP